MYVYTTRQDPFVPLFADDWEDVWEMKNEGKLVFVKKVASEEEGTAYIEEKATREAAGKRAKEDRQRTAAGSRKWCATTEELTIYSNDRGFFTRMNKKVGEEWKTLFIPVFFNDNAHIPTARKSTATVDLHWCVIGHEDLKLAIVVDKVHSVTNRNENVEVPF